MKEKIYKLFLIFMKRSLGKQRKIKLSACFYANPSTLLSPVRRTSHVNQGTSGAVYPRMPAPAFPPAFLPGKSGSRP